MRDSTKQDHDTKTDKDYDDPHVAHVHYKGTYKSWINKTISVPVKFHGLLLLQCFISYLKVKSAEKAFSLYKFVTAARDFISFLDRQYERATAIPNSVLKTYSLYLSEVEEQVPSSIRTNIGLLREVIEWSSTRAEFKAQPEHQKTFVLAVLAQRPSIPNNSMLDGTALSMSELVNSKEYDDLELLNSLIRFCFGFLTIIHKHRSIITSYPKVRARLDLAMNSSDPDIDWHFLHPNWDDYNEIFNAIVSSRDPVLLERLLFSNERFQIALSAAEKPENLEGLYAKLKTCVREIGSLAFTDRLDNKTQYVTFEELDIRSLLSSSEAEEICLRWLLAVDRIQQSGQKQLTLEDIDITPTHLTISFLKRRSNQQQRESTSHKRKTLNFRLIKNHFDLREEFVSRFGADGQPKLFFQFENPFARRQHSTSISYRSIIQACTPNTNFYVQISNMFPGAKVFQEYFMLLIEENSKARQIAIDRLRHSKASLSDTQISKIRTLSANVVAQSRAIVDPEVPKTRSPFDRKALLEAASDGTAHSIQTSQEVYKNRSQTTHRLGLRAKFVSAVGKLQVEDARRLSAYMGATTFLTLDEINELLGWNASSFKTQDIKHFNLLIDEAESQGYNCAPFGWLSKEGSQERIIIITPVTAALILSYIQGCQTALKTSEHEARSRSIILQLCYAKLVLNAFDSKTVSDGKILLENYNFPAAII